MTVLQGIYSYWRRAAAVALIAVVSVGLASPAFSRDPLLIPGKKTLFQRVLTRPDAKLSAQPGDPTPIATFPPFEIFYVYGEKTVDGRGYIEVGRSLQHGPEGWMVKDGTIEWKQSIVLGFNNPAGRERALIFKSRPELEKTLAQEDVSAQVSKLRSEAVSGNLPEDSPIISIEPSEYVDIENAFYILPILEASKIRLPTNISAKLLRVASIPERPAAAPQPASREDALKDFRIGITFVVDTTKSMQPYIDQVRNAIAQLRDSIAGSPEADRFRFGLVAFRDNTRLVPGLEYVSKVVLPLDETSTAEKFVSEIEKIKASQISSASFDEDSIAGIRTAIDGMNWEKFGGKLIILVTDAGPRAPGPDAASGDLAPEQIQPELERKQIALMTLHLKSEAGRFDHEYAEQAYRAMSRFNNRVNYFPIENADPEMLRAQVTSLATQLQTVVSDAIAGRMAQVDNSRTGDISVSAGLIGRAMQLAYLGSVGNVQAPDVFEGWLTDRDPLDRGAFPVTPFLLMSRNELSALRDVVQQAIELGTSSVQQGTSDQFFNRLREAVALISVRPDAVQDAGTLGDLLGEYLADLPYTSEITNLTPQDWRDLPPTQERQVFDTLRSKVVALEKIHNDERRWHALSPDAPPGEYVSIVPLSLMP